MNVTAEWRWKRTCGFPWLAEDFQRPRAAFPDEAMGTHQEASAQFWQRTSGPKPQPGRYPLPPKIFQPVIARLEDPNPCFFFWFAQSNKLGGSTTIAGKAQRDEWSQSLHPSCGAFELYQSSPGDVCPGQARHKMELLAMSHMCRGYAIRIGSPDTKQYNEHEWKAQVPNTQHIGQVMSNCCTSIVWWVIWL